MSALFSTQGLVLHTTNYSETSVIARVFTRLFGVKSFILKGVRGGKNKAKNNLLQPLSFLDMVVYNNPNNSINYVKELHIAEPFNAISADCMRTSVVFFLNELLYKTLREEEPNEALFDYVVETLEELDRTERLAPELPIRFMLHLATFIGLEPLDNQSHHEPLFNLKEGRYQAPPSRHSAAIDPNRDYLLNDEQSSHLHYYLAWVHGQNEKPILPLSQRRQLIDLLISYFSIHLDDFGTFKSHEILHAVLE